VLRGKVTVEEKKEILELKLSIPGGCARELTVRRHTLETDEFL
jgi:hypothetical protein